MNKRNINLIAGLVLIVTVYTLIGSSWSSAFGIEISSQDCGDTFASKPDFHFNARLAGIMMSYGGNCHPDIIEDQGDIFLVNAEPVIPFGVAGNEGQCSPE